MDLDLVGAPVDIVGWIIVIDSVHNIVLNHGGPLQVIPQNGLLSSGCANAAAEGWKWITGEKISKTSSAYTWDDTHEDDGLVLAIRVEGAETKFQPWTGGEGDTDVEAYICQSYWIKATEPTKYTRGGMKTKLFTIFNSFLVYSNIAHETCCKWTNSFWK